MSAAILSADQAVLRWILALPHPTWLNWLMESASYTGVAGAIWLGLGVVLALTGKLTARDLARLVVAIVLVHVIVDGLVKPWVDRPRPPEAIPGLVVGVDVPESRSFPSGHAANAAAAALVLHRVWKRGRRIVWPAAALVAVARVYLGIHYPVDAMAGILTGLACGWIACQNFTAFASARIRS